MSLSTFNHRIIILLVAIGLMPTPREAFAQQMDPNMPMSMPVKKSTPTPSRVRKPAMRAANPGTKSASPSPHDATPHGQHVMPPGSPPMEGMDMDAMPDMAPMDHTTMDHGVDAATEPRTPIPVLTDADRMAAKPPAHDHPVHDSSLQHVTLFDRLETSNAGNGIAWNARAWFGGDMNRLWLRSEGSRVDGHTESADLEVLAGHSVAPWWDVVAGIRHDFDPGRAQDFAAIGVQGVAPYKIEVDATAYVGQGGQTAARVDAEYESLLTNRLILQPHVEVNLYGQDDPDRGIGSGLSTVDAGLRLRYEITRRFAPYIGIVHERAFGATARFRRDNGNDSRDTRIVAGVRFWF